MMMVRITNYILWACFLFCSDISAEDHDYSRLENMSANDTIRKLRSLRIHSLEVPEKEQRLKLWQNVQYHASRNANLKKYFEKFFRETPHTFQTAIDRNQTIFTLGLLNAEWSVRLLFEEVMVDRRGQQYAGYEGEISEKTAEYIINSGKYRRFIRNDQRAAIKLKELKLKGLPASKLGGVSNQELKELREWYPKNKHRLDEVVKETWGERAILDKDMVLGTGQPKKSDLIEDTSHPRGKRLPTDDDRRQHSGKGEDIAVMGNLKGKWLIIVAAVLFFGVVFVWLKVKSRA